MRKRASLILAFGLVALVIAACGRDDDDDAGAAATSVATSAVGAQTTPAAPAVVRVAQHPTHGAILVDAQGRTLYRFTRDTAGTSNCYDNCAQTWPIVTADTASPRGEGISGQLTMIDRRDGTKQVAYQGVPLYRYAADQAPGEAKGEGVGGIWFVVKASGTTTSGASPTTASGEYAY